MYAHFSKHMAQALISRIILYLSFHKIYLEIIYNWNV
jgi:hypothetical protein